VRIALVVHQYLPEHVGGTEVYTWSLAEALAQQGHDVTVFVPDRHSSQDTAVQQGSHLVWRAPAKQVPAALGPLGVFRDTYRNTGVEGSYERMLRARQPDIVHIQHLQNVSARLPELSGGRPVLLTLHDYWLRCATTQLVRADGSLCDGPSVACAVCVLDRAHLRVPRGVRGLVALPVSRRNAYLARAVRDVWRFVAPSDHVREQYLRWGWEPEKIVTIPNGVSPDRLGQRRSLQRNGESRLTFGYLGSIAPVKGVHVLVEAARALPADAQVVIYGSLETYPAYARSIMKLAAGANVCFAGPVAPQEVGAALGALDYLVVPSLFAETYCQVVDEAQAVGVPVVASRIGALTRIREGMDGRLFEPGNAEQLSNVLLELCRHPEKRQAYADALPTIPTIADQALRLSQLYAAALAAQSPSGQAPH